MRHTTKAQRQSTYLAEFSADGQNGKTTIIADDMNQALDLFCQRHGFIDYPDYCGEEKPELNIEAVNYADN